MHSNSERDDVVSLLRRLRCRICNECTYVIQKSTVFEIKAIFFVFLMLSATKRLSPKIFNMPSFHFRALLKMSGRA